jgi:REase_DpnII-MboI
MQNMDITEIIKELARLKDELGHVLTAYRERGDSFGNQRNESWRQRVGSFLEKYLPNESQNFNRTFSIIRVFGSNGEPPDVFFWNTEGNGVVAYIDSLIMDLRAGTYEAPPSPEGEKTQSGNFDAVEKVKNICERFHIITRQLRKRHAERSTLDVEDEYDVQDLLHTLLHLDFEDIRPEEPTPSNAGQSSRVDFLLKPERVVIETKKTRKALGAKEVGTELIADIHRYRTHPDCDILLCFVYDPEARINNPRGLEDDLRKNEDGFRVEVWIRP